VLDSPAPGRWTGGHGGRSGRPGLPGVRARTPARAAARGALSADPANTVHPRSAPVPHRRWAGPHVLPTVHDDGRVAGWWVDPLYAQRVDARRSAWFLVQEDVGRWSRGHAAGLLPGRLPYGIEALEDDGFDVHLPGSVLDHALPARAALRGLRVAGDKAGIPFRELLTSARGLRSADVCLSMFEDQVAPYVTLSRAGVSMPPLVLFACWLAQRALIYHLPDVAASRRLLRDAAVTVVFSGNQVPILSQRFGVDPDRLAVLDFGIDTEFFRPAAERSDEPPYLAAVGGDIGRDWPTFMEAAAQAPELRFKLATWPDRVDRLRVPPNVELLGGVDRPRYRELLQQADAVVLSSHPHAYPTGQTVLLESYACGAPVAVGWTAALADYLLPDVCETYVPGDPSDLARACRELSADADRRRAVAPVARQAALARFDSRRMWSSVAELVRTRL